MYPVYSVTYLSGLDPPARSRGAPSPREDRASGAVATYDDPTERCKQQPAGGRASEASSAWGWGPKRNQECGQKPVGRDYRTDRS